MASSGVKLQANQIHGYYETIAALRALDKNAARRIDAAINKAAKVVADKAKSLVVGDTLSGWERQLPGGTKGNRRAGYDEGKVKAGIRVKRNRQRRHGNELRSFVVIANTSVAGAIWEVAGRSSAGKTPQGVSMIKSMSARDGAPSRTVWRAADDSDMGGVQKQIAEQIEEARRLVQSKIDRA